MVKSTWVHHTFCPLWVWGTRQSIVVFPKTSKQSTKLSLPGLSRCNEICAVWNNSWWMPGMAPFGHFTSYSLGHKHFSKLAYSKCSVLKKVHATKHDTTKTPQTLVELNNTTVAASALPKHGTGNHISPTDLMKNQAVDQMKQSGRQQTVSFLRLLYDAQAWGSRMSLPPGRSCWYIRANTRFRPSSPQLRWIHLVMLRARMVSYSSLT